MPFLLCITRCSRHQPLFHISPMHRPLRRELLPYTSATLPSAHTRNFHSPAIKKTTPNPQICRNAMAPLLALLFPIVFVTLSTRALLKPPSCPPRHPPISAQCGTCPLLPAGDGHAKESRLPGHISAASGGSREYPHSHNSLLGAVFFSPSASLAARTTEPCPLREERVAVLPRAARPRGPSCAAERAVLAVTGR